MSEYIDNVRLNGVSIPIRDSDAQQKIAQMGQLSAGNGIESAVLNADYTLTLNFTDGTSYTSPSIRGADGQGLPAGGSAGQAMVKRSGDNQDAEWKTLNGAMVATSASDSTPVSEAIAALESGLAVISNGNTHGNIQAGQFVYVMNHDTLGAGLYSASSAIAQNAALSTSNLTAVSGGGLNAIPAIVSNANGRAYQFPSGLMICTKVWTGTLVATDPWGSLYEGSVTFGDWAVPFIEAPEVSITNISTTGALLESCTSEPTSSSIGTYYFCRATTAGGNAFKVNIVGIGKWK